MAASLSADTLLLASHFLTAWGWRTWEFAIALLLISLSPTSFLLVALYGLLDDGVRVLAGPYVGRFVDANERLTAAGRLVAWQHTCVGLSVTACGTLLLSRGESGNADSSPWNNSRNYGLAAVTIFAGVLAGVGAMGSTVAVEKDWATCWARGDAARLATLNARMRAVDLTCLLAAPLISGLLMTYAGLLPAAMAIGALNAVSWWPEVAFLAAAQRASPELMAPKNAGLENHGLESVPVVGPLVAGWRRFAGQRAFWPMASLSLLYLTVLSLGMMMTAYLKTSGVQEIHIAIFRGFGAAAGLAATAAFPTARERWGLAWVGRASIAWQLTCLLVGAAPTLASFFWTGGITDSESVVFSGRPKPTSTAWVLMAGLAASRFGLWGFDLAVTQLMQETVAPPELGAVSATQASLCAFFETLSFVASLVIHAPRAFPWLMAASLTAVAAAAATFWATVQVGTGETRPESGGYATVSQGKEMGPVEFGSETGEGDDLE